MHWKRFVIADFAISYIKKKTTTTKEFYTLVKVQNHFQEVTNELTKNKIIFFTPKQAATSWTKIEKLKCIPYKAVWGISLFNISLFHDSIYIIYDSYI